MNLEIEEADPKRIEIAFDRLMQGYAICYCDVSFNLSKAGALEINSFSEFSDISYVSVEMAKSSIENSKLVLKQLLSRFPALVTTIGATTHEYYHCCDYGKGSVAVASEKAGGFSWLLTK